MEASVAQRHELTEVSRASSVEVEDGGLRECCDEARAICWEIGREDAAVVKAMARCLLKRAVAEIWNIRLYGHGVANGKDWGWWCKKSVLHVGTGDELPRNTTWVEADGMRLQ